MADKKRVLFLCVGNSCRSQMAEGWLRQMASDRFDVFSAGSVAAGLNPRAVKVMAEVGIDISRQRSKRVERFADRRFDYVVTVCDESHRECPVFVGQVGKRLHWPFDDPAEATGRHEEVLLLRVDADPGAAQQADSGAVLAVGEQEGIVVQAHPGAVIIRRVKPSSGRAMDVADFIHGRKVQAGDRLD